MQRPLILFCLFACSAFADEAHDSALIQELLKMPAPPPDWRLQLSDPDFLNSIDHRPPENARDEELVEYWSEAPSSRSAPSQQVQLRLIDVCTQDPQRLPHLLRWFSETDPEIAERLKALYDHLPKHAPKDFDIGPLYDWLKAHSLSFREVLIEQIRATFAGADAATLRTAVQTLARLDRPAAERLMRQLAASESAFTRTAALVALLELAGAGSEAERTAWHAALQRTATDHAASAAARDYAISGVMRKPEPGDEDWFVSLFSDPSLAELRAGDELLAPLCRVVADQPTRWVPRLVAMIDAGDRMKHGNAALCLSDIPQAKALRPLLPWLTDASWSPIGGDAARRRLMRNLASVELPEAVPGLVAMLQHPDPYLVEAAAEALVQQKGKGAGHAVRDALAKAEREHTLVLARAAVALDAFTTGELVQDLELFVRKAATNPQSAYAGQILDFSSSGKMNIPLLIGEIIVREPPAGSDFVNAVLRRAELAAKDPALADRLRTLAAGSDDPAAVTAIVRRLRSGDFTAHWLAKVLEPVDPLAAAFARRDDGRATTRQRAIAAALAGIEDLHGLARGVQAAVTGIGVHGVLRGHERSAILSLLASARLARTHLPVAAVAPLLDSADPLQIRAAEQYLIAEDSAPARALVLQRHPGEIRVLDTRTDLAAENERARTEGMEETLRESFRKPDAPSELFGLLSSGGWGGAGDRVVAIMPAEVRLNVYEGSGRRRSRILSAPEMEKFRSWMASHRVDDLAPFDEGTMDGVQYNYVHLTRDGGRRVFMNNPPGGDRGFSRISFEPGPRDPDPWVYGRLVERFIALENAPMKVIYDELEKLPGYQLIHRREDGEVRALSFDGQQLLAHILDRSTRETERRVVEEHGLSKDPMPAPASSHPQERAAARSDFFVDRRASSDPDADRVKDGHIWSGTRQKDDVQGLWLERETGDPELLVRGWFGSPVITPDGAWLVAAKCRGKDWASPNDLVRVRLADRREERVDLAPADQLDALAWIPAHRQVLVRRARDEGGPGNEPQAGPEKPEFYLLDPATGALTKVTGDFRPYQERNLQLQPTETADEGWAALPSFADQAPATSLCRYNTRTFTFVEKLKVPGVRFESTGMWVEPARHRVTFAVNGDILRLSLPD